MEKVERLNLINSCTGYKSANLIATKSENGESNVAIFSSITHLGSDPALLGFIMRPTTVPRDTYKNIKETGFFTVNHITENMIADAHHTSANYDFGVSEFDKTNLEEEYKNEIDFPFVKPVALSCNGILLEKGWLQLDKVNVVSLNGLGGYCLPKLIDRFEYARKDTSTKSFFDK